MSIGTQLNKKSTLTGVLAAIALAGTVYVSTSNNNNNNNHYDNNGADNGRGIVEKECFEGKDNSYLRRDNYVMIDDTPIWLQQNENKISQQDNTKKSKPKLQKKDPERLELILTDKCMINDQKLFRALIEVESTANFLIGSKGTGSGIAQITNYATAAAMAKIYSTMYPEFQERHSLELKAKKEVVNGLTDNYFVDLDRLVRSIIPIQKKRIERSIEAFDESCELIAAGDIKYCRGRVKELKTEKRKLSSIETMVNRGYVITDQGMVTLHDKTLRHFSKNKGFNEYMVNLTGIDKDWVTYLGQQTEMVKKVHKLAIDKNNPELNILIGDTYLAQEIDYHKYDPKAAMCSKRNVLKQALEGYNKGGRGCRNSAPYYDKVRNSYEDLFGKKMRGV